MPPLGWCQLPPPTPGVGAAGGARAGRRVCKAPKGAAVFEEVAEEQLAGVVVERPQAQGRSGGFASGLLQFAAPDGANARLPFGPEDLQARRSADPVRWLVWVPGAPVRSLSPREAPLQAYGSGRG